MLLPPTGRLESVSGKSSDWSADVQRTFHTALVSCCSQCVGLLVQKPLKVFCALSISAWLRLSWLHTKPICTLFWWVHAPPCLDIVPWCWLLPMLAWLHDLLHLAEPLKMQTWSYCTAHTTFFFPFLLLHAFLLNHFTFPWMLSVPDSAMILHAIVPKCAQKVALFSVFCRKTHVSFLEPYWSITPVVIWLITMLDTIALICTYL